MEFLGGRNSPFSGEPSSSRPTSVPLKDTDWDAYIQERKLLQPPSGVTPPIAPTPLVSQRVPMAPAVQEALSRRKQRESMLLPDGTTESSDDVPLARSRSSGPVQILPPRRYSHTATPPVADPGPAPRVRTFEELNERHREKMRDLQAPLTQAEKEHAELEAARQRWERSKAMEKEAVTRRQAQKVAAMEKKRTPSSPGKKAVSVDPKQSSSKRRSVLKVEDWQRFQEQSDVPFPGPHR